MKLPGYYLKLSWIGQNKFIMDGPSLLRASLTIGETVRLKKMSLKGKIWLYFYVVPTVEL